MKRHDCRAFRGSVVENNGYWCYAVKLPGEAKRRKHPLRAPGAAAAMRTDRLRELAIEAAHRLWEAAVRQERRAPAGALIGDIIDAWARHVSEYYRGDGSKYIVPTLHKSAFERTLLDDEQVDQYESERLVAQLRYAKEYLFE